MTLKISLPWPSPDLSPNARLHWSRVAAAKAKQRQHARITTVHQMVAQGLDFSGKKSATLTLIFCPPDARKRDMDNVLASLKAALDGIADATAVDDSGWCLVLKWGQKTTNGRVDVLFGVD